jgi:glycosyltransferase involved in cell wall biosynthesis
MIDVVLANFNHANSITAAIDALNNQSFKPYRIYIIDDASTDDSWAKLMLASEKYDNIELIRNYKNEGVNNSYNRGLQFCTSDLVYFAAADDITYPNLFEKCTQALISNPQAAFASAEVLVSDSENTTFSMRPIIRPRIIGKYMKPECVKKEFKHNDNWIMTGTCVYKRDFVRDVSGLDSNLGAFSDSFLAKKLAFKHGCIFLKFTGLRWNITKYGYSRSLYSDYKELSILKSELQVFCLNNKEFPNWYWKKFLRRLAFNEVRLSVVNRNTWFFKISRAFSKFVFFNSRRFVYSKRSFRPTILLIAYIKFRPYSISRILKTYIVRLVEKIVYTVLNLKLKR